MDGRLLPPAELTLNVAEVDHSFDPARPLPYHELRIDARLVVLFELDQRLRARVCKIVVLWRVG